jgi:hypothetical protein
VRQTRNVTYEKSDSEKIFFTRFPVENRVIRKDSARCRASNAHALRARYEWGVLWQVNRRIGTTGTAAPAAQNCPKVPDGKNRLNENEPKRSQRNEAENPRHERQTRFRAESA